MRHIETIEGNGTVTTNTGERVGVHYTLNVFQKDIPATSHSNPFGSASGMKEIHGHVEPVGFFGQILTLEMQDGRKLKFFFTDGRGSISASGGWVI
jgi:hypothetical protein